MGNMFTPPRSQDILGPFASPYEQPTVQRLQPTGNEGEGTALGMFATSFLEGFRQSKLQKMQQQENALIRNVKLAEADLNAIMADENIAPEAKEQARRAYQQYIGNALATNTAKGAKKNPIVGFINQFAQGLTGGQVQDKAAQSDPNEFFRLTSELRTNPEYSIKNRREMARKQLGDAYSQIMKMGEAGPYTTLNDALQDANFRQAYEAAQNAGLDPTQDARLVFAGQPRTTEEQILRLRAIDNFKQMRQSQQQAEQQAQQQQFQQGMAQLDPVSASATMIGAGPMIAAARAATQPPPTPPSMAATTPPSPAAGQLFRSGGVTLRPLAAPQPTKQQLEQAKMTGRSTFETFYDPTTKQPVTLMVVQDKLGQWDGIYDPQSGQRVDPSNLSKDVPKGGGPPDPEDIASNKQLVRTILQGARDAGVIKQLDADRLLGTADSQIDRGQFDKALGFINQFISMQEAAASRKADRESAASNANAMRQFGQQMQRLNFGLSLDKAFDSSPTGKGFIAVADSLGRAKNMIEMALTNPSQYDTAQVHSAILTAFAKMQDPNSVVRPSEFDEAAKTLGYVNYNFNRLKGELAGRGNTRMTPQDMQKFLHVMEVAAKIGYKNAEKKAESYVKMGQAAGLPTTLDSFPAIQVFREQFPEVVQQVEAERRVKSATPPSRPNPRPAPANNATPPIDPNSPQAKQRVNPWVIRVPQPTPDGAGAAPAQPTAPAPAQPGRQLRAF
jgi:hypothetical protein